MCSMNTFDRIIIANVLFKLVPAAPKLPKKTPLIALLYSGLCLVDSNSVCALFCGFLESVLPRENICVVSLSRCFVHNGVLCLGRFSSPLQEVEDVCLIREWENDWSLTKVYEIKLMSHFIAYTVRRHCSTRNISNIGNISRWSLCLSTLCLTLSADL